VLADGTIAGTVRNDTPLTLVGSILVAGTAVAHVPDLPPHTARFVRIQPSLDSFSFSTPLVWEQIYGPSPDGSLDGWDGDLWEEPPPPPEHTLNDRMRNAAERLPDAQTMLSLGEVVFAGWTTASLGNFTVNGVSPRRRDLTMVVTPLSVHFAPGTVQLLPGTLGPHLVDARLQPPQYGCCYTLSDDRQSVALGAGGSATFEFDLPVSRPVQVRRLLLSVDAAGVTEARVMQLYNWQSRRWVQVQMPLGAILLKHADSYVSPRGALQLRLLATKQSGDVVIGDPRRDLQLSGLLTVR
jgi:hypothetical protein